MIFSGGGARAHPPGVAPEASVEYLDSSEVFYTFYWGMVCCGRAPEPHTHGVDQGLGRLLSFDPHAPSLGKRRRGGERHTTPVWASSDDLR
jgi:hypothetical protein